MKLVLVSLISLLACAVPVTAKGTTEDEFRFTTKSENGIVLIQDADFSAVAYHNSHISEAEISAVMMIHEEGKQRRRLANTRRAGTRGGGRQYLARPRRDRTLSSKSSKSPPTPSWQTGNWLFDVNDDYVSFPVRNGKITKAKTKANDVEDQACDDTKCFAEVSGVINANYSQRRNGVPLLKLRLMDTDGDREASFRFYCPNLLRRVDIVMDPPPLCHAYDHTNGVEGTPCEIVANEVGGPFVDISIGFSNTNGASIAVAELTLKCIYGDFSEDEEEVAEEDQEPTR